MSAHSHDDHHITEQKPVAFTVPFILGCVAILITVMFLSLCDPKPHHAGHDANHEIQLNPADAGKKATEHSGSSNSTSGEAKSHDQHESH